MRNSSKCEVDRPGGLSYLSYSAYGEFDGPADFGHQTLETLTFSGGNVGHLQESARGQKVFGGIAVGSAEGQLTGAA